MRIRAVNLNAPAVIVLGAGATRGASFVRSLRGALPPLDGDFFTQLQRLSAGKPAALIERVIENVVRVFGKDFNLTLEQYLTHIEQLTNVFDDYKLGGRPADNPYPAMHDDLIQALFALLDESVGHDPQCSFHEQLVKSAAATDTLMSFNYDWVIDNMLKTYGQGKWNPRTGYGVAAYHDAGADFWAARRADGNLDFPPRTLNLLKMHGSMNWFPVASEEHPRIRLRQRWWHQQGNLRVEIAPPEWNKPIRSGVYKHVWRQARRALRTARVLALIGYSLPETDLPARALFMVDTAEDLAASLRWLIIANPDKVVRQRIRRTLIGRVTERTRILTFGSFEEFSRFLEQE